MPCPPSDVACELGRIADQLSGWDWDGFAATLVATLLGALFALLGAWLLAQRDGKERNQLRLTEAIVRTMHAAIAANNALGLLAGANSIAEVHSRATQMGAAGLELSAARLLARPGSEEERTLLLLETLMPRFIGDATRAQHPERFKVLVRLLGHWPKSGRRSDHEALRRLIQVEINKVAPVTPS